MAIGQRNAVLRQIERLFTAGSVAGISEGQLLDRFVTRRDEDAFAALVARHGPMVLGVCRQMLRDPNDVDDAFQATFLVLVRKAATLRDRHLLGNWLYGVASRVALRARAVAARRSAREAVDVGEVAVSPDPPGHESGPWLHEEVHRLPEKYRAPVVLCYLEGLSHAEAADQLGWPVGTVKGRLARARDLLRARLTRRGLTLSGGALAALLARDATAAVPPPLAQSTVRAAVTLATGQATAGLISSQILALTEGALRTMALSKLKNLAVALLIAGTVTTGAGVLAYQKPGEAKNDGGPAPTKKTEPVAVKEDRSHLSRIDLAREALKDLQERLKTGILTDPEPIYRWSIRLVEAQREINRTPEDRIDSLQRHLDRIKEAEGRMRHLADEGRVSLTDALEWQYRRLEAEQMLADAKATPAAPATATKEQPVLKTETTSSSPMMMGMMGGGMRGPGMGMTGGVGGMGAMGGVGGAGMMGRMPLNPEMARKRIQDSLRVEIADFSQRIEQEEELDEKSKAIFKKLEEPVAMSFANETPLEDVLKYIKQATAGPNTPGLPIYVDPVGLQEAEKTTTSPVQMDLEGVPLKTTLRLALKQLGLAFCVKDGVLIISSVNGIYQELKETLGEQDGGGGLQ